VRFPLSSFARDFSASAFRVSAIGSRFFFGLSGAVQTTRNLRSTTRLSVRVPAHFRFWPSVRPPRRTQSIYESFKKCKHLFSAIGPFKRKRFQFQSFTESDFSSAHRFFTLFLRRNFAASALFNRSLPGVLLNFSEEKAFLF
jgi:hypothetical protein